MAITSIGYATAWKSLLIGGALAFMYSMVLWKLGYDWWTDDNYSHGLLVPLVIGYIIWYEFDSLRSEVGTPATGFGSSLISGALILLLGGTLASVLFAQRFSLVVMIAGIVSYFFGIQVLKRLAVPFLLLLLAIPIPQILFNKIAFPLQLLASRIANLGIAIFGIPADRKGNVIEIIPVGTAEVVSLEIVEACSGIRSLMTLITLALILGYFTRERRQHFGHGLKGLVFDRDFLRTILLMTAAVPVALGTNAARVIATGSLTYYYGSDAVEGIWHDISGSIVFAAALVALVILNLILKRVLGQGNKAEPAPFRPVAFRPIPGTPVRRAVGLFVAIILGGLFVNWFQHREEVQVSRKPLSEIPRLLGSWEQRNEDIRFDAETEKVLRASDYVMRDYYGPGKRLNLYVGYYASQRSGATYHSPLSCLPGTGWEMTDPQTLQVSTPAGRTILVNRYVVQQGGHREYLVYWYQGRGRTAASEYVDKIFTSLDSLLMRRSDGGMIRIMTPVGKDPQRSLDAAIDLTGHVADSIGEFIPE